MRRRNMDFFEEIILKIEEISYQCDFLEEQADFHIAFGIDKNFARGMGILIDSIRKNNSKEKIVFHVFTDEIELSDLEKLKIIAAYPGIKIKLYYIDINAFKKLPTTIAWSYATYYRFIMGKVLYGTVDKVLYLDADILCIGSLSELKEIDMGDAVVLGIGEPGQFNVKRLGLQQEKYFNAGVLYIDINKWNSEHIAEQAVALLQNHPEKYPYLDQDVLNVLLDGKTCFINKKWNYLYDMRKMESQLPENIVFIHFIGDKPWQKWSEHHFMVKLYNKYAEKSLWKDVPLVEPRHYKDKKRMARSYAKQNRYGDALFWYIQYAIAKIKTK
jgi:lipopolysaccharide biosynthesis glycosyltransferase